MSKDITHFVNFVRSGKYGEMKNIEKFLKDAKEELKQLLYEQDGKRFEFKEAGMVARFTMKPVREINMGQLIEDLSDYVHEEYLIELVDIDMKKMTDGLKMAIEPFLLPRTYYARPTLNKIGKSYRKSEEIMFGGQSELELILEIKMVAEKLKRLEAEYDKIRNSLNSDLKLMKIKKVKTSLGSITYVQHKPKYNKKQILKEFTIDFFINYGCVNMERLNEFIAEGKAPSWILTANKELKDIAVSFSVMTIDAEAKMFKGLDWKRKQLLKRVI